jgi:hypothetical protein
VSRAREFETFKNIPRYSHSPLAVIHPAAEREIRPIWKPPKKLNFDGTTVPVQVNRFNPKNIPEHLVRPEIDEEKLMQIRAN